MNIKGESKCLLVMIVCIVAIMVFLPKTNPVKATTIPAKIEKPNTELPRGIRNNNPGNIERNSIKWKGMSENQSDSRFVVFESPEYGIRALCRILRTYQSRYDLRTINEIINRYAPSGENYTENYIAFVEKETGYSQNKVLDLSNNDVIMKLVKAIIKFENGQQPYDNATIQRGINYENAR